MTEHWESLVPGKTMEQGALKGPRGRPVRLQSTDHSGTPWKNLQNGLFWYSVGNIDSIINAVEGRAKQENDCRKQFGIAVSHHPVAPHQTECLYKDSLLL
jgi:hypothetical protein